MFNAVILSADPERARMLKWIAQATALLELVGHVDSYVDRYSLPRLLNSVEVDVWIVDLSDARHSLEWVAAIRRQRPKAAVIGIQASPACDLPAELPGVSSILPYPPGEEVLAHAVDGALHQAKGGMIQRLFVFMPSKAGSGASTVALNTAKAAADLSRNAILLDADLRSGVLSLMLKQAPDRSMQTVLRGIADLDSLRWPNCVHKVHGFDLLASNRDPRAPLPSWVEYFLLLNFVKPRYDVLLVDLPELVNPASVEFVRRADLVFLVCTAEVLSLKLAHDRFEDLARMGVAAERVRVVLNRWVDSELAPRDVEKYLQHPVMKVLPKDYLTVRQAIINGTPVQPATRLGKAVSDFTSEILGLSAPSEDGFLGGILKRMLGRV